MVIDLFFDINIRKLHSIQNHTLTRQTGRYRSNFQTFTLIQFYPKLLNLSEISISSTEILWVAQ